MTQEQMATRTGKDRASIGNFLRLMKLPEPVQQRVESGELTFGHARSLLSLSSPKQITAAAQKVVALAMSVRQTETYINHLIHPETKPTKHEKERTDEAKQDANVHEVEVRLQRALGLRVKVDDKNGKGRGHHRVHLPGRL